MKDAKPTSIDIAYLAGVSQSTVSRALRNSPLVNEETRVRVQQIAKELNYKVDKNARNLRSQETRTLALLLCEDHGSGDSLINPFFLSMLGSITHATANHGYDLLVSFQQSSNDWRGDFEDTHRADGIIFLGYGDYDVFQRKLEHLINEQAHFITWGPVFDGQHGISIGCDNEGSAFVATEYLLGLGLKQIAFLGDVSEHSPEFAGRYQGYCEAHQRVNVPVNARLQIDARTSEEEGYKAVLNLLQRRIPFDAVFAASDLIAIGAMKALEEAGLHVPNDVSVMGFDDLPVAAYTYPPLTTVQQNTLLAGELLVGSLLKLIAGEEVESMLLPATLKIRGSCRK